MPDFAQIQRLADRLTAVQHKHFVGRTPELELIRSALAAPEPPFAVFHLYGPGGIGKTTLLNEYTRLAQEASILTVYLDGRSIDPSPPGFLSALGLMLANTSDPLDYLARYERVVLLIDTYENLTPLDDWLRTAFLPRLPSASLTVIAGRNAPDPAWRTTPGWRDLVRIISLRNLPPEESRRYLQARGIAQTQHPSVVEFTHGHPLALALVADVVAQRNTAFDPENEPDIVRVLLEQFVQHVPSPQHREALEICAHARVTTEALLVSTMNAVDAHRLFEWLHGLSFIEQSREGLFPHDLARDVLDTNLRWRNPTLYRELHYRVRGYVQERLYNTRGIEQQSSFFDLIYLHRHNPVAKSFYQWKSVGQAYITPAVPDDFRLILDMVRHYEGDASAQIADYWQQRQPQSFQVFRSFSGELIGFMAALHLESATTEDIQTDPAVRTAMDFVERHCGLRPGEELFHFRFWMAQDTYQALSSINNLVTMGCTLYWLSHPHLALSFIAMSDTEYWSSIMAYANQERSPDADFEVGGRRYSVFTHDWRKEPAMVWMDVLGERELASAMTPELQTTASESLIVLSQPEFEEAVRNALRDYTRPDALAQNPLLRSRVLMGEAENAVTPQTLQQLVHEATNSLRTNPKDNKLYRALYHTYIDPAPTQEAAAELLALPFSTYRYHLTNGIKRVVAWLWQRELYGAQE